MHRKDINRLRKQAATAYGQGKKKEAYEMWAKADVERKAIQRQKQAKSLKLGPGD